MKFFTALLISLLPYHLANAYQVDFSYGLFHAQGYANPALADQVSSATLSGKLNWRCHEASLSSYYHQINYNDKTRKDKQGLGDNMLAYKYRMGFRKNTRLLEFQGKLKLPGTYSEQALGSGEIDYEFNSAYFYRWQRAWLFAKLGYKWRGDSDNLDMNNGYLASLGTSLSLGSRLSAGLLGDYRQASSKLTQSRKEILSFISFKHSQDFKSAFYLVQGYSDSSAKLAAGVQFTHRFDFH